MKLDVMLEGGLLAIPELKPKIMGELEELLTYTKKVMVETPSGNRLRDFKITCYSYDGGPEFGIRRRIVFPYGYKRLVERHLSKYGITLRIINTDPPKWRRPQVFDFCWDVLNNVNWKWMQRDIVETLLKYRYAQVKSCTGYGKAQPLWAIVQTPDGPRQMGELRPGHMVLSEHGTAVRVLAVHPQGRKPVYRVTFKDGGYTHCCGDHLWQVTAPKLGWRKSKVLTTDELRRRLSKHRRQSAKNNFLQIPICEPLQYAAKALPITPYTLGVLLGDGCFRGGVPSVTTADPAVVVALNSDAVDADYVWRKVRSNRFSWSYVRKAKVKKTNALKSKLQSLGLWGLKSADKFVPPAYLVSSVADRLQLLQGLMDTDGTVSKAGQVSFCSTSFQLARAVVTLVESLGGLASLRFVSRKSGESWLVELQFNDARACFRLERKRARVVVRTKYPVTRRIVSIDPVGEENCQCISVDSPSGLYLTDHCAVTHNSFLIKCLAQGLINARILITSHSTDVVTQIFRDILKVTPSVTLCTGTEDFNPSARIIVCSGKSLHKIQTCPDLLMVDEGHEFGTEDYVARVAAFRYARRWMFSANCGDRSDGADFELDGIFGPVVIRIPYQEAVKNGCVVPVEVRWVRVHRQRVPIIPHNIHHRTVRMRLGIWANVLRNNIIAQVARSFDPEEQSLIVVDKVEHAVRLKSLLPDHTLVYGEAGLTNERRAKFIAKGYLSPDEPFMTDNRRRWLSREFSRGNIRKAIATGVWNRGVDFKALSVLIRADGLVSTVANTQIPGRVSRTHEDLGKQSGLIIDFTDEFDEEFHDRAFGEWGRKAKYALHGWPQRIVDITGAPLGQRFMPPARRK